MRMSRRMGLLGKKKTVPPTLLPTLAELFADMTVVAHKGREGGSAMGNVRMPVHIEVNPSMYVFAFCSDSFAIHHLISDGSKYSKTTLYRATDDSNATDIYINKTFCYLSKDGSSNAAVYGGTIIAATFPSYTDNQISAVFSEISVKNSAGRNASKTSKVFLSKVNIAGEIILTAHNGAMCAAAVASPTEYIYTSSNVKNYNDNINIYLSTTGASGSSVYGGTILTI